MFGLKKPKMMNLMPKEMPSKREMASWAGKAFIWGMKRTRSVLYKEYEDDLYSAVPTISITVSAPGPLAVTLSNIDTTPIDTSTAPSDSAAALETPEVVGILPAPVVYYADVPFNTTFQESAISEEAVWDPTSWAVGGEISEWSREPPEAQSESLHAEDGFNTFNDPLSPHRSHSPSMGLTDSPYEQTLVKLAFDKLRRSKRGRNSLNGHSRTTSGSSTSTLINTPNGGSRTHSWFALDLALSSSNSGPSKFTTTPAQSLRKKNSAAGAGDLIPCGIEQEYQERILSIQGLEDRNEASVGENLGPSNVNNVEHQFRVSLDMAVAKVKAYKWGVASLKKEKKTLIKETDATIQHAMGVAQRQQYELEDLKGKDVQAAQKSHGTLKTAKGELETENTRPCGLLNNLQMQHGLLLSQAHFLSEEQKYQVKEYTRLAGNHLRFRQDSMESRHEKEVTEQNLVSIAARFFDRMVRLTLWLAGRGLTFIDDEYKDLCKLAFDYLGLDEQDINARYVDEADVKGENCVNGRPTGSEAMAENQDNDDVHHEDEDLHHDATLGADRKETHSSEAVPESQETHNLRRQQKVAALEQRLLGSIMTVDSDVTLKAIEARKECLPSHPIRQASSYTREDETIYDNTSSKTCRTPGIPGNDFRDEGREVQTLFRRGKLAKVQLLDPPVPGSLVEGSSDRSSVSPALNDDSINLHLAPADDDPNSSEGVIDSNLTSANEEVEKPDDAFNRPRSGGNDYDNSINADNNDETIVDETNAGDETKDREELARSAEVIQDVATSADPSSPFSQAAFAGDVSPGKHPLQDGEAILHNTPAKIIAPPENIPSSFRSESPESSGDHAGTNDHVASSDTKSSTEEKDTTVKPDPEDGVPNEKDLLDDATFFNDYDAVADFNKVEDEDISDNEDQVFLDENGAEVEILDQRETESGVQIAVNYKGETVWVMKRKKGEFYVPHVHPEWASFERYGDAVYEAPNLASDKEDLYGLTCSDDKEDELLHDGKGRPYSEWGQYLMSGGLPFIGEGVDPEIDDDYDKRLGYWSSDEDSEEDIGDEGDDDGGDSNDDQAGNHDDPSEGSGDDNGDAIGQAIDASLETPRLRNSVPSTDDARKSSAPDKTVSHYPEAAVLGSTKEETSATIASDIKIPAPPAFEASSAGGDGSTSPAFNFGNYLDKSAFPSQKTLSVLDGAAIPNTQFATGTKFSDALLSSGQANVSPRQAESHSPKIPNRSGISTSPAFNFGIHAIRPASANSKFMSLAEAAAAPNAQYTGGFNFLKAVPLFGQTKAELGQAEHRLGNDDITRFDDKARADDLKEFASIFDKAEIQDNSSTKAEESESQTNRSRGQAQTKSPIPPKVYRLPQSNTFDFGSSPSHLPTSRVQIPSFAAVASENNAKGHAGFSFSLGFVANARAPPAATEQQISPPAINLGSHTSNPALAHQKTLPPAEALAAPDAQHAAGFEFWKPFQSSCQVKSEFGKAGASTPNNAKLAFNTARVNGIETVAANSERADVYGTTAAKADQLHGQAHTPASTTAYSPPRLNNFSFSSESLNRPDFSGFDTPSFTATHPTPSISRFAFQSASLADAQTKVAPSEEKIIEQVKPAKPKVKSTEPKANNAETVKPEAKAAKPKVNIAAVIALKKKTEVEKKAAEEKQRELSRKQREAAARRKEKGGAKGGRV